MTLLALWRCLCLLLFGLVATAASAQAVVSLTSDEHAYLQQKGVIKFCVQPDWLPFQRINEEGRHEGIAEDMLQLMAERLGARFALVPTKDWAESVAAIRARRCDMLPLGMDIPSRHDLLDFSRPYVSEPLAVVTRTSEPYLHQAEDIGNRRLGLIKGFAPKKILQQMYPFMNIVDVESTLDGLQKVQSGENFGYIDNLASLGYTVQKRGMLDLKISHTLNFTHDLGIVTRNDEPLLGKIMQKGADSISDKERKTIVSRWVSIKLEQGFNYSLLWKLGAGATLLLLGFAFWNRKLALFNRKLSRLYTEIQQKNQQIATLLDNSGQGFLSCGKDLMVEPGYSRECTRIFAREVLDRPLPDLLCPDDAEQRELVAETLQLVIAGGVDALRQHAYLSLLPREYGLGGRFFRAEYRLLDDGRLMLILTDISDEKALQQRLTQERLRLEFVVNALENRDEFLEVLRDFDTFRRRTLPDLLSLGYQAPAVVAEIFRHIHTFKSLFAQASLPTLPTVLHTLETHLGHLRDQGEAVDINAIKCALADSPDLGQVLEQDLGVLREKLGPEYFNLGKEIRISAAKLEQIEVDIDALCGQSAISDAARLRIVESIRRLCVEPLHKLIEPHFRAAEQLAVRQEKLLHPIVYDGDVALVDPEVYGPFCKSLIHLLRNAVDHGVEDADTRLMSDKDEVATIRCRVQTAADHLTLTISDDGRGIDPAQIRSKALELGKIDAAVLATLDDAAVLRLVFLDGLTTRTEANAISGRGVGLAAVYQELERVGGSVQLDSVLGQGTQFVFTLPYQPAATAAAADTQSAAGSLALRLLAPLPRIMRAFCQEQLQLAVTLPDTAQEFAPAALFDFTVLLHLGSGINATLGLSIEPALLLELAQRFEPEFSAEEAQALAHSVGAEIANIVFGNATVYYTPLAAEIAMSTPHILAADERLHYLGPANIRGLAGSCAAGRFIIFCLLNQKVFS